MAERYQLPRSCIPPTTRQKIRRVSPIRGLGRWKDAVHKGARRHGRLSKGVTLLLKATLPACTPNRHGLSLLQHASEPSPAARGLGPACHADQLRAEEAKPPRVVHATAQRLQVILHLCPDQRAREAGGHAGSMQPRQVDASPTPDTPAWRPRPTRRATSAPDAACKQLHRLRHHRASSIAEPIPRLEATQRATQQRQPDEVVNAAKSGPAVMTVAGAREQRSRRQPSSRPIRGQQENPLSQREDNAPVIRSSNGSRTRNGRPANYSPRRINSAAGQAALLAGAAGDASPSPKQPRQKRYATSFGFVSFSLFPLSLSLATGTGKGGIPRKGSFPVKEPGSEPPY